ncbi:hypothetical protein [Flavobacterium hydatis]|uniref:DUF3278 domain-containing protein n=1 Tax=Flavobacterium hydatis TaxID=991 RepID=A0A086AF61_FLAHY|nr:hypothetical protein [Flavobacterium hydatis]KFF15325.1 hypothetical protein IW20_14365 [Flavobacterium hydatis]OXA98271.1 hypothetical protein B0A62_00260 [Flavobacterium hydatis]
MDFNDIQNAWNDNKPKNIVLPSTIQKLETVHMPLDKIRKNLRLEFLIQLSALLFVGFIPTFEEFPAKMLVPYYLLYGIMLAISIYYLAKLFLFYKRLDGVSLNTKDSLYETYYDIKLNMQLYKTFTFSLIPFVMLYFVGYVVFKMPNAAEFFNGEIEQGKLIIMVSMFMFTILIMGLLTEIWVYSCYGKYARQIKKILDELKEE